MISTKTKMTNNFKMIELLIRSKIVIVVLNTSGGLGVLFSMIFLFFKSLNDLYVLFLKVLCISKLTDKKKTSTAVLSNFLKLLNDLQKLSAPFLFSCISYSAFDRQNFFLSSDSLPFLDF